MDENGVVFPLNLSRS